MLRFAPSPTGDMHIGNLKVAILNYIVSRQLGVNFVVRIEDTDTKRNIEGKDKDILEILNLFGLAYSDVYYQSDNLKYHQKIAFDLVSNKKAFNCFCTKDELEIKKNLAKESKKAFRYDGTCEKLSDEQVLSLDKPSVIRIKKPDHSISYSDEIKGELSFAPDEIDNFVILREDKKPTFNFACSVDDMLLDISFVIRGEDHVSNTPKQIVVRDMLGYDKNIKYAHLPIILNMDGKKMSKRDDASSVEWLLDEGFLPSAIINYLVALGYKTPKEIFTLEEAVSWFDISKISRAPAKFDIDRLRFINRAHINIVDDELLASMIGFKGSVFGILAKFFTQEASTLKEIKPKIDAIVSKKDTLSGYEDEIKILKDVFSSAPKFDEFDDFKSYMMEKSGLKGKKFFMPLRFLLTGSEHGPNLSEIYPLIHNIFIV